VSAALAASCVPWVEIAKAPCPCPNGFTCCETTFSCVASAAECPARYPPASETPCTSDADCKDTELCLAWESQGTLAGPRVCRTACPKDYPCAQDTTCQLAAHGGLPLKQMSIARLCVPTSGSAGCADNGCGQCAAGNIGQVYCDGKMLRACFVALHPTCGLVCDPVAVECPYGCGLVSGGPACLNEDAERCAQYDCAACGFAPGAELAGGFSCQGNSLVRCAMIPDQDCGSICHATSEQCVEKCLSTGDGPRCGP
jgi:hypothetical protein